MASAPTPSRLDRMVAHYRRDHTHPVNSFLHLGVGWPLMAVAVILVPFRPLWSVGLFFLSYGLMFAGHFLFEGNRPTILKHPTTPFVIAWAVILGLLTAPLHLIRSRSAAKGQPRAKILN